MPLANEHAARIRQPGQFDRLRRQNNAFKQGVHAIWGIKQNKSPKVQSIRFSKTKFTPAQAKSWLKQNGFKPIEFEPAEGS